MKSVNITLNSIDKVKSFVNIVSKYDSDFDLVSGRYVIDAKSKLIIQFYFSPSSIFLHRCFMISLIF